MNGFVHKGERLDELGINGLCIIQQPENYCFTSDSVLLANFVQAGAKTTVVDLCSGSGIIGILIAAKNNAKRVICVELQSYLADMSRRSVQFNGLDDKVHIICGDAKQAWQELGRESADAVVCNPPYYRLNEGLISDNPLVAQCRHELTISLESLLDSVDALLKFGGKFYVVYRADRLAELIGGLQARRMEPKEIVCIQPAEGKEIDTVLVAAKKGAEKGVRVRSLLRSTLESDYTLLRSTATV